MSLVSHGDVAQLGEHQVRNLGVESSILFVSTILDHIRRNPCGYPPFLIRRYRMFHTMRRKIQQLSPEEAEAVLLRGTAGVLALTGDEAFPLRCADQLRL